jgi:hypothetical protein
MQVWPVAPPIYIFLTFTVFLYTSLPRDQGSALGINVLYRIEQKRTSTTMPLPMVAYRSCSPTTSLPAFTITYNFHVFMKPHHAALGSGDFSKPPGFRTFLSRNCGLFS